MKVYVSKYALTRGIIVVSGEVVSETSETMFKANAQFPTYYHKPDWHLTMTAAANQALLMVQRKRVSIKKALLKLAELEIKLRGET